MGVFLIKNLHLNIAAIVIGLISFCFVMMYQLTSTGAFWTEVRPIEAALFLTLAILIPIVYLILVKYVFKLPIFIKTIILIISFFFPYLIMIAQYNGYLPYI